MLVYAQPVVDLRSGDVSHHQLLIRMCAEDGSIVSPGSFLPVDFSVIEDIDRWMLGQAATLSSCGIPVALHLSAQSVAQAWLLDCFREEIALMAADPSLLVVELTEAALLTNERVSRGFVRGANDLGARIALADFGLGSGDVSYMKGLPIDLLTIAYRFAADLANNEANQRVVRAAINVARKLGQATVAKGVDDERTLGMLCELGVDYALGPHIGEPAPIHQALAGAL